MMTMNATRSSQVSVVVVVLIAAFMLLGSAQAQPQPQPSNEAIWQQFLEWLPSAPPVDAPRILLDQYRSRLISNGASTTEADRQMGT